MEMSESIKALVDALVKAQSAFPPIPRTKEVLVKTDKGAYSFMYAPLDAILALIRPVLNAHGLAVSQAVSGEALTTILMHTSGEWIADSMPLRPTTAAQQYGAELTYKRRYSLTSMVGIAAEDDLDAKGTDDKPLKKSVKVTAEAYDSLPIEAQANLTKEAKAIEADFYTKDIEAAFKRYEDLKTGMEQDEQIALWHCMDSKVRAAIKKHGQALK